MPDKSVGVSASPRVIDPAALAAQLSATLEQVQRPTSGRGSSPGTDIAHEAEMTRAHIASIERPTPVVHPGWRGAASARVKAQVRRLIYWYVDPVFDVQQNNARLMSEQSAAQAQAISELRREVTSLQESLADLRRLTARLQHATRSTPRPSGVDESTSAGDEAPDGRC